MEMTNNNYFSTYSLFKIRTDFGIVDAFAVFRKNGVVTDLSNHPNECYYLSNEINNHHLCFREFILHILLYYGRFEIIPNNYGLNKLKEDLLNKKILENEKEISK